MYKMSFTSIRVNNDVVNIDQAHKTFQSVKEYDEVPWRVAGALHRPKGMHVFWIVLVCIVKAILLPSFVAIGICLNLDIQSEVEKN